MILKLVIIIVVNVKKIGFVLKNSNFLGFLK
jgi:hypothetical protein